MFRIVTQSVIYGWEILKLRYHLLILLLGFWYGLSKLYKKIYIPLRQNRIAINNEIYLTRFAVNNKMLYVYHLIYSVVDYYSDFVNLFCLMVSMFQICFYNDFRSAIPLSIFTLVSSFQYMYEILPIIQSQFTINGATVNCILNGKISEVYVKSLKLGDEIILSEEGVIPADILLTSPEKVMVNEFALNGEDLVTSKVGVEYDLNDYQADNLEHNSRNMVFRGTNLIDKTIHGKVVKIGNNCKIYQLSYKEKNLTDLQKRTLRLCERNLYLLIFLSSVIGIILTGEEEFSWKLLGRKVVQSILLFNTMIPLSLQFFYNSSCFVLTKRLEKLVKGCMFNVNGRRVFQHLPKFIVTDKTGTLTVNKLEFKSWWKDGKEIQEVTGDVIKDIMSCTAIDCHSKTGQVLSTDDIEEKLISKIGKELKIVKNFIKSSISGKKRYEAGGLNYMWKNELFSFDRHFYKEFSYEYGFKIALVDNELHIQGMPERISSLLEDSRDFDRCMLEIEATSNKLSYTRIIAHAKKEFLGNDVMDNLYDFTNWSIYVFSDMLVENIDQSMQISEKFNVSVLTGDKLQSALHVSRAAGLVKDKVRIMHNLEDVHQLKGEDVLISGSMLEKFMENDQFKSLIERSKSKIIYRASPHTKQLYISFLQKTFNEPVMMIGDGLNDISAIIQADIGVAVKGENYSVRNVADVVLDDWNGLPDWLLYSKKFTVISDNVCKWVLTKHMLTAFSLFGMLLASTYEQIKDPIHPLWMSFMNMILFIQAMRYAHLEESGVLQKKEWLWTVHGTVVGFFIGMYLFYYERIELTIPILLIILNIKLQSISRGGIYNWWEYILFGLLIYSKGDVVNDMSKVLICTCVFTMFEILIRRL